MTSYTFKRRRVVEQVITVDASSYREALAKARTGYCDNVSDDEIISLTIKPIERGDFRHAG